MAGYYLKYSDTEGWLKGLQKENGQFKKLVADLPLDKAILKEALSGNY